MRLDLFAAV